MTLKMPSIAPICLCAGFLALSSCLDEESSDVPAGSVLVVTTDYATGSFAVVDAPSRTAASNLADIHADAVCAYDSITQTPFVLERGNSAVTILDPLNNWSVAKQYSVGAGTNPQGLAVVSDRLAFVPRLQAPMLLAVEPLSGKKVGEIDLSTYADADGNPEAGSALVHDGKVYVTLQRLDEAYAPASKGGLLWVNPETLEVAGSKDLFAGNPTGRLRYSEAMGGLVLIETGQYGVLDGGVEIYDVDSGELSGLIVTEQTLGGDVQDAVIVSKSLGYAIIGTAEGKTGLVSFDPASGTKLENLIVSEGWDLAYLELNLTGTELWVADRTFETPGIRIFDTGFSEELTDTPINVGLPPFVICFVE
jgi:hypothetical protein